MADEYTPTTEDVREWYADSVDRLGGEAEFDRWLAAHDRETAARAWDEGYRQGRSDQADHSMYHETHTANPYREGDPT